MKRADISFTALTGFLVMYALPVMAQEHHEGGKKMLPQLDVSLYPGLLFWLIFSFLALFIVMTLIGLPGIQKTLAKRKKAMDSDLKAARKASEEAEAVVKAYEASLHQARAQAQETVNGIVAEAAAEASRKREAQDQEIKHRLIVAQENIAKAKETAMQEVKPFINDIVQDIVKKVMESGLDAQPSGARK